MKINRIHLRRFGCFENHETHFQPGLNVIKGPNEAGKSTLLKALLMALLERPGQKKANEPYRTWGKDGWYILSVDFDTIEGESYSLIKDFGEKSQVLLDPDGNSSKSLEMIQSVIEQTLGTSSLNIFKSTVCVEQGALNEISAGQKEISQSLEQIITGGEVDGRRDL